MIYSKTDLGQQVVKDRSVGLSPKQRSALILFDGKRSTPDVLQATAAMGVTVEDVRHLLDQGLIGIRADLVAAPPPATVAEPVAVAAARTPLFEETLDERDTVQRYRDAYPVAIRLTSGLGLRGFRLNLAVEAAADYDALRRLAPKIKEAVGLLKYAELAAALGE
jgi:hypothetical protein